MKIQNETFLINEGPFSGSHELKEIMIELHEAIQRVTNHEPLKFIVNPAVKGNGVFPIKNNFIAYLSKMGWIPESRMTLAIGMNPGAIDAVKATSHGLFAVEWETGNISSSHRALNKIAVGIIQKQIIGGVLILPTRNFSRFLTDRVGNYEEIAPYFVMYNHLEIKEGFIAVIGIEHDNANVLAPIIPKGKDGNAKKPSIS